MLEFDRDLVAQRKAKLDEVSQALKQHFVGIDQIIDDLIAYIQVWYLMPELLKRPVIVNLWGMTGVGKTDLVRQLVRLLDFRDRFAEVELSNIDQTFWQSSVSSVFDRHELHDGKPCIVLFDEIQRFNTLDVDGKPMEQTRFMDFWSLLSDGSLARKDQEENEIDSFLARYLWERKRRQKARLKQSDDEDEFAPYEDYISTYELLSLRKTLNLDMDMETLFNLTEAELIEILLDAKKRKTIYEPVNHAQTLILISGNLDEVFQVAGEAAEADIDADIFHAITRKVTLMDVKNALLRKFRPEQVARFGNIHLIYPSLRKQDFRQLIQREVARVQADTVARTGVSLTVDESMQQLIYRNGVFPAQGVRPLFSSITDILDVNLSGLLLQALSQGASTIHMQYDSDAQTIVAQVGAERMRIPFAGRVDKVRASNNEAVTANISVHEAGHATVYMLLFALAPMQLQSRIANSYAGGFTFPHQVYRTRRSLLDMAKVYLAGGLAEELVFGAQHASIGRAQDREEATRIALDHIRRYGFEDEFQANYVLEESSYRMNTDASDGRVERLVAHLVAETSRLLSEHQALLVELALALASKGKLESAYIAELAQRHGLAVAVCPEDYMAVADYEQWLNSVVEQQRNCS